MGIIDEAAAWMTAFWSVTGLFVSTVAAFCVNPPMMFG